MNSTTSEVRATCQEEMASCPFRAWNVYLPSERYGVDSETVKKVNAAKEYMVGVSLDKDSLMSKPYFFLNWPDLMTSSSLRSGWPTLQSDLVENPELVFGAFGLAKHQMLVNELGPDPVEKVPLVRARILSVGHESQIEKLKTRDYGRLITVKGTVVRVSTVRPACAWLAFECCLCLSVQSVHQPCGRYQEPVRCAVKHCSGRRFSARREHSSTTLCDRQTVRLQERVMQESGRVPKTVDCDMTDDLCDSAVPGDVITVSGVVWSFTDEGGGRVGAGQAAGRDKIVFVLYIRALSVKNESGGGGRARRERGETSSKAAVEFTDEDYDNISEVADVGSQVFKLLVHSLSPSIYGHEIVKAGLLLGLFGGKEFTI